MSQLPTSINIRDPKPGFMWKPTEGEHAGHVMELVSTDGIRFNICGDPLRSWLLRCTRCLDSWAVPIAVPSGEMYEGYDEGDS